MQGRQGHRPHDDDNDEEVEENNKEDDNNKDDNNDKGISALDIYIYIYIYIYIDHQKHSIFRRQKNSNSIFDNVSVFTFLKSTVFTYIQLNKMAKTCKYQSSTVPIRKT